MNKPLMVPSPLAEMIDQDKVREIFERVLEIGHEKGATKAEMAIVGQTILAAVIREVMENHDIAQANILAGFLAAIPAFLVPLAEGTVKGALQYEERLLFGGDADGNED